MSTDHLAEARARAAELRAAGELPPRERLDPVERARRSPKSLRAAVNARCWQCCGSGQDVGTRQTIRACSVHSCALWVHRPYQTATTGAEQGQGEDDAGELPNAS